MSSCLEIFSWNCLKKSLLKIEITSKRLWTSLCIFGNFVFVCFINHRVLCKLHRWISSWNIATGKSFLNTVECHNKIWFDSDIVWYFFMFFDIPWYSLIFFDILWLIFFYILLYFLILFDWDFTVATHELSCLKMWAFVST